MFTLLPSLLPGGFKNKVHKVRYSALWFRIRSPSPSHWSLSSGLTNSEPEFIKVEWLSDIRQRQVCLTGHSLNYGVIKMQDITWMKAEERSYQRRCCTCDAKAKWKQSQQIYRKHKSCPGQNYTVEFFNYLSLELLPPPIQSSAALEPPALRHLCDWVVTHAVVNAVVKVSPARSRGLVFIRSCSALIRDWVEWTAARWLQRHPEQLQAALPCVTPNLHVIQDFYILSNKMKKW